MQTKYVILEQNGLEIPIILSELQQHADVIKYPGQKVVSAGFVSFHRHPLSMDKVASSCFGQSISLGVKSRRGFDELIIDKMILGN